jgi:hypothetical protein
MQNKKFLIIGLGLFALVLVGGVYWATTDTSQLQGRLDQVMPVTASEPSPSVDSTTPTDSDSDGLSDEEEVSVTHSDPKNPDSDGGGLTDGSELEMGRDPLDPRDDQ